MALASEENSWLGFFMSEGQLRLLIREEVEIALKEALDALIGRVFFVTKIVLPLIFILLSGYGALLVTYTNKVTDGLEDKIDVNRRNVERLEDRFYRRAD